MISRYNASQTIWAICALLAGMLCYGLAYLFFRYLPPFVASRFGWSLPDSLSIGIAVAALVLISWSGYRNWKRRGGLYSYHESALYHDFGEETAGALAVGEYTHRITGPAYVIGQIFLSGPVSVLKSWTLWKSIIPNDAVLEGRLKVTLEILKSASKWQSIDAYPNHKKEILYLAQMNLIDFSSYHGAPRIKANRNNGV